MPLTLSLFINQSLKLVSLETRHLTGQFQLPSSLLMATIVVPGFNNLFHVSHLSFTQWLAVIVGSFLIVVLVELVKAIQRALGKDKDAI